MPAYPTLDRRVIYKIAEHTVNSDQNFTPARKFCSDNCVEAFHSRAADVNDIRVGVPNSATVKADIRKADSAMAISQYYRNKLIAFRQRALAFQRVLLSNYTADTGSG